MVPWIINLTWLVIFLQTSFLVKNATLSLQNHISLEKKAQTPFALPFDELVMVPVGLYPGISNALTYHISV